jgi:hypothetical protein
MSCPECGFASDEANESQPVCPACSAVEPGFSPEDEWDEELVVCHVWIIG